MCRVGKQVLVGQESLAITEGLLRFITHNAIERLIHHQGQPTTPLPSGILRMGERPSFGGFNADRLADLGVYIADAKGARWVVKLRN